MLYQPRVLSRNAGEIETSLEKKVGFCYCGSCGGIVGVEGAGLRVLDMVSRLVC